MRRAAPTEPRRQPLRLARGRSAAEARRPAASCSGALVQHPRCAREERLERRAAPTEPRRQPLRLARSRSAAEARRPAARLSRALVQHPRCARQEILVRRAGEQLPPSRGVSRLRLARSRSAAEARRPAASFSRALVQHPHCAREEIFERRAGEQLPPSRGVSRFV